MAAVLFEQIRQFNSQELTFIDVIGERFDIKNWLRNKVGVIGMPYAGTFFGVS